jgi:hypothetical protein
VTNIYILFCPWCNGAARSADPSFNEHYTKSSNDCRLPSRCEVFALLGYLRSVDWQFVADVSRQPVGPTFKGQAVGLI